MTLKAWSTGAGHRAIKLQVRALWRRGVLLHVARVRAASSALDTGCAMYRLRLDHSSRRQSSTAVRPCAHVVQRGPARRWTIEVVYAASYMRVLRRT